MNERIIIYGAGKKGAEAIKKVKGDIYFADKDIEKIGRMHCGKQIVPIQEIGKCDSVILASNSIPEMYHICLEHEIRDEQIRIFDKDMIFPSYKDWCVETNGGYWFNKKLVIYNMERKTARDNGISNFMKTGNLYDNISVVGIMLSNLCGYACFHKKCPASLIKEKEIMPTQGVKKIINELSEINYAGTVNFHVYNEPLMDPRLFTFIQYAKQLLPKVKIQIYTNAYYLNQVMIDELYGGGICYCRNGI